MHHELRVAAGDVGPDDPDVALLGGADQIGAAGQLRRRIRRSGLMDYDFKHGSPPAPGLFQAHAVFFAPLVVGGNLFFKLLEVHAALLGLARNLNILEIAQRQIQLAFL